jgi:succinoglycan biosynthesis protein ExoM
MTEYSSPIAAVASTRHASTPVAHICVCICTFHRPVLLRRLLEALITQQAGNDAFTLSCVVVDNDPAQSAAEVVREIQQGGKLELVYECEAEKNFAAVRNQAVKHAHGDFVAFIDDDEVP